MQICLACEVHQANISLYVALHGTELSQYCPVQEAPISCISRRSSLASQTFFNVCVADSDKSLGDAVISRFWLTQETLRLLREAVFGTTYDPRMSETKELKHALQSFLHAAMLTCTISYVRVQVRSNRWSQTSH